MNIATYYGIINTTDDALLIFEACRLNLLKRRIHRLCENERRHIKSGSVFVWDETESGIRRWTDGKRWSPSRVSGCFLIYNERAPKSANKNLPDQDIPLDDGLTKKALSLLTNDGIKLHIVCYYKRQDVENGILSGPSNDPYLKDIQVSRDLYPEVIPDMMQTLYASPQTSPMGGCRRLSMVAPNPSLQYVQIRETPSLPQHATTHHQLKSKSHRLSNRFRPAALVTAANCRSISHPMSTPPIGNVLPSPASTISTPYEGNIQRTSFNYEPIRLPSVSELLQSIDHHHSIRHRSGGSTVNVDKVRQKYMATTPWSGNGHSNRIHNIF